MKNWTLLFSICVEIESAWRNLWKRLGSAHYGLFVNFLNRLNSGGPPVPLVRKLCVTVIGWWTFGPTFSLTSATHRKKILYWSGYPIALFWVHRELDHAANLLKWTKPTSPARSTVRIICRGWRLGPIMTTTVGAPDHTEPPCPIGW